MRKEICVEGKLLPNLTYIKPGALTWDKNAVLPVIWNFDFSEPRHQLGNATDIRREDDGTITAEITVDPIKFDAGIMDMVTFTIYAKPATFNADREVTTGHIIGVSVIVNAANPGAEIK